MTFRLHVFGSPLVEGRDGPVPGAPAQRKSLALLALLARSGRAAMSRDRVLAYLWPEADADRAGHRLTQLLYALRRDLGAEQLFLGTAELRLNPAVMATDLADFIDALECGEYETAVKLYQGPFLDGFFLDDAPEFERWAEGERAELARRLRDALEDLARSAQRREGSGAAIEWWRRLAATDPLNARVAVAYMTALAAAGDRAGALQHAHTHERLLREELDVPPEAAVLDAAERLRQPPAAAAGTAAQPTSPSIAVLPFLDISPDRDNEYFSDGITEELTHLLARVPGLRVASRTAAFALKGRSVDPREVGERLRAEAFVEGSVRKVGDRIRVTAQLVDVATGYQRWSATYERKLENIFALQEELSRSIADALPLGAQHAALTVRPSTTVLDAYTLYLRGRFHAVRRTPESFKVAIEYFEQAVELDPGYALAHAALAECWMLLGFEEFGELPPLAAMPTAKASAERSLALDDRLAEGYVWRGSVAFLFDHDWTAAEADLRRAIELRPELPSAPTWYAAFLCAMLRPQEALAWVQRAADLDPLLLSVQAVVGLVYYYNHRFDEAIARHRALLSLDPTIVRAHAWIALSYFAGGRAAEGLELLEEAVTRLGRHPALLEGLGRGYALTRRPADARRTLAELKALGERRPLSPLHEATIYRALGEDAEFQRCVELAADQRSGRLVFFAADPTFAEIRDLPWVRALMRRLDHPG